MKVWILTSQFGQGHFSAAKALAEEFIEQGHEAIITDVVELAHPKLCKAIYGGFNHIICRSASVYNFFNQFGRNPKDESKANKHLQNMAKAIAPDLVITTWSACARMLGDISAPVYVCITDVGVHAGWICNKAKGYFVADNHVKKILIDMGVAPETISVRGIPVKKVFRGNHVACAQTGKKVLIMGGGLGILPWIAPLLDSLLSYPEIQITVITGKNKKLHKQLTNDFPLVKSLGYTQNVHTYLKETDIFVSKPGGVSMFESINTFTPIVAVFPEYEQEFDNAQFIERNAIGKVVYRGDSIGNKIISLLENERKLSELKSNVFSLKQELEKTQNKLDWKVLANVV